MAFVNRFSVDFAPTAVTVAADILQLTIAATNPVRLHGLFLGQSTDVGDAAMEILSIQWVRGNATTGSGGGAVTPVPLINSTGSLTAATTALTFNTTQATTGTPVVVMRHSWNIQQPLFIPYNGDLVFGASSSDGLLCLRLGGAPADSITVFGSIVYEELQGPGAY